MKALVTVVYLGPAVGRTHSIFRAFDSEDRLLRAIHQASEKRASALVRGEADPWPDGVPLFLAHEILGTSALLVRARNCRWEFAVH